MRQLFICVLVLVSFSALAEGDRKAFPDFMVISSEKDPKLAKSEAVFEFRFMNAEILKQSGTFDNILFSCNNVQQQITLDATAKHDLKVKPGIYRFQFFGNYLYYEIYSDSVTIKPGHRTIVEIRFTYAGHEVISDKPVIYFYPSADLAVTATVNPTGEFTFTYPSYENGWNGVAHPDGSITIGSATYPYLFWEAKNRLNTSELDLQQGFVVPKEQTVAFLEEKLTAMGLNDRERTDFITYWGPRMIASEQNFVQFLFNDDCSRFATLSVDPQPAQLFRLYMLWAPATEEMHPQPQLLQAINREQFYVIEWGGSQFFLQSAIARR